MVEASAERISLVQSKPVQQRQIVHHPTGQVPAVQQKPVAAPAAAVGQQPGQREAEFMRKILSGLERNQRLQQELTRRINEITERLEAQERDEIELQRAVMMEEQSRSVSWLGMLVGGLIGFDLGSMGRRD